MLKCYFLVMILAWGMMTRPLLAFSNPLPVSGTSLLTPVWEKSRVNFHQSGQINLILLSFPIIVNKNFLALPPPFSNFLEHATDILAMLLVTGLLVAVIGQVRAKVAFREKASLLQLVLDNLPDSVAWKDLHGRYLGWNKKFQKEAVTKGLASSRWIETPLYDETHHQIIGLLVTSQHEKFLSILDELDSTLVYLVDFQTHQLLLANQATRQRFPNTSSVCWEAVYGRVTPCHFCNNQQLVTAEGKPAGVQIWELHDPSSGKWFHMRDRAIWWLDGKLVRLTVATDITTLKQMEVALHQSEERFELARRGSNDGLWDWNLETHEVYCSSCLKQMLGYQESEIGKNVEEWTKLLHPDDLQPTLVKMTHYLDKQIDVYEQVCRLRHKQGHYLWILSHGFAVCNEEGKTLRMVGTYVDITSQKQVEEDLRQAKEAAEVASRAKSAFLANMSHELRTPLNGILGYVQILMRDRTLTDKQREGLQIIERSGEHLLTLINDILDLSKIEAGRVELVPYDFHFGEFLQGITDLFKMRAHQKGLVFLYEPLSPLPLGVRGDEKRLRQVLINLIGNAVKFTERGSVILKVGASKLPPAARRLRFQVVDTGTGIARSDLEKIFLPFQQVGDKKYQNEGTGLGLSITKKLIEMMGGELQVESIQKQGSTFWFEITLPEVSDLLKSKISEIPTVIIGFEGGPRKILVVDDKWENRSVLKNLLMPLGFEIAEANQGQECLDKLPDFHPDLIVMDLVMPIMDGFEATRQIRHHPEFHKIPIIAASASVFEHDQQQSLAAGCNAFLSKPIRAQELLELFATYLEITWIHEDYAPSPPATSSPIMASELVELSKEQAGGLLDLALMGDIAGIVEYINRLEQADAKFVPFGHKIRQLAKNFEEQKICELIEECINNK